MDKPISEQRDWALYKDLVRERLSKAVNENMDNSLKRAMWKRKVQVSNAALLRSKSYCGARPELTEANARRGKELEGGGAKDSQETTVNIDQMSL